MAEVHLDGDRVRLVLSAAEKVEGLHLDLSAPASAITGVEVLEDAHQAAGLRAGVKVGTRVPGIAEVGRVIGLHKQRFVAVHHDTPRGVRICFDGANGFDEWIVGSPEPEALAARVTAARQAAANQ